MDYRVITSTTRIYNNRVWRVDELTAGVVRIRPPEGKPARQWPSPETVSGWLGREVRLQPPTSPYVAVYWPVHHNILSFP